LLLPLVDTLLFDSIFGIYVLAGSVFGLISFAFFWCPLAFKQFNQEENELADKFGEPYKLFLRSVPLKIFRS